MLANVRGAAKAIVVHLTQSKYVPLQLATTRGEGKSLSKAQVGQARVGASDQERGTGAFGPIMRMDFLTRHRHLHCNHRPCETPLSQRCRHSSLLWTRGSAKLNLDSAYRIVFIRWYRDDR
jgi:hypothetical protein